MMPAVDLVCLGYNPWTGMWKRNQQMVAALSRLPWIRNTLFVNPEVWASSLLSTQVGDRNTRSRWSAVIPRTVSPRLTVITPIHLPLSGRVRAIRELESVLLERVVRRTMGDRLILLVNRPVSPSDPLVSALLARAALKVFDWSDDFETFANTDADRVATREACEYYLRSCDVTVAINEHLGTKARSLSKNVHVIRNGTDTERFAPTVSPAVRVPKELRTLRHPVIGYAGYRVRDRLDLNLIDELAASRPNWSFVFIGPHVGEEPLREITARRPNVVALGPVDYSRLPSYVAAFDVCILPNRINAHTAGNDPIKLYDYLAAGKPIVSTQTSGADKLGDMVTIADSGPPFLEALERAMETDSIALRDERVRTAAAHSWKSRASRLGDILYGALIDQGVFQSTASARAVQQMEQVVGAVRVPLPAEQLEASR